MAFLRNAINNLDPKKDKKTELTLALNLLTELSESKVREFEREIIADYRLAGTNESFTIPIKASIATQSEYRAYVKDDAGKIATEVADAIKKFVDGGADNIITGIADLVTTGLTAILGGGQAIQQEMKSYFVTAQEYGLVRYDIRAWRRIIEAEGITSEIEACLALYASKASVDVTKLDLNTFLLLYSNQLHKMGIDESDTLEYLRKAEEIYHKLIESNNKSNNNGIMAQNSSSPSMSSSIILANPFSPGNLVFSPEI